MQAKFQAIMDARRKSTRQNYGDMLETLMEARYSNNVKLQDQQIGGLLLALLLAGQHTSSTTTTWMGLYMANDDKVMERVLDEIDDVVGDGAVEYDMLDDCEFLSACLTETLRLSPPIITMMRKVMVDQTYKGYVIPKGHYLCTSPLVTALDKSNFKNADAFEPERFLAPRNEMPEGYGYTPFGANRTKCIGEPFARMQIRTIWIALLRMFKIESVDNVIPDPDFRTLIVMPGTPRTVKWERI